MERVKYAKVYLWDTMMGVLAENDNGHIVFEYTPEFVASGYNPSPLYVSPKIKEKYSFPELSERTFKGLPAFIADALPDKFGTELINQWLDRLGRPKDSYTTIERLLYQGSRAMGAMSFQPQERSELNQSIPIELEGLIEAAAKVLSKREQLQTNLETDEEALLTILRVGTSAGGARPKAVIAYNPTTKEMHSGQVDAPEGFEHYILKLDGVDENHPYDFGTPLYYGCLEYAYYQMAKKCGIEMMESHLVPDGDRRHFMTKRFDRVGNAHRVHMVSLCGMAQYDYNIPGAYSYEQLFGVMRALNLPFDAFREAYRRMVFNVIGCNQDDHTKNISFLLDTDKVWRLSPAYDMTYAKGSGYTRFHQMTINAKRDNITREDMLKVADSIRLKREEANAIIDACRSVFSQFESYVDECVPEKMIATIKKDFVINI